MILILIASSYLYNAIVDKIFFGAIIPETTRVKFIRVTTNYADEEFFTLYNGYSLDDPIFTQPILESYHNYTWEFLLRKDMTYHIELSDTYGDGWSSESYLLIVVDDIVLYNLTMKDISLFREEILIGTIPNYLHVTEESQCEKISENTWKSIVVESGLCNSMTGDLRIENYPNLYNLIVKQQSLMNLNSLTITNNPYLSYFGTDATFFLYHNGTFGNVKNVEISRLLFFYSFILR